ncbi:MAG TPA: ThuA domain-containing protein [Ruminiclostridium sp.]
MTKVIEKKNALFLGDYTDPKYHPAKDIDELVKTSLDKNFNVTCTENYNNLTWEDVKPYDIIIDYADCSSIKMTKSTIATLLTFLVNGNGILGIHNGIIVPTDACYEILHVFGGKFIGHTDYVPLDYYKAINFDKHPIMDGFKPFTMSEEPYQFELEQCGNKKIIMEYMCQGYRYSAAWVQNYGLGRVVYLAPGHDTRSFMVPQFQRLIARSAEWAARIL